MNRTVLFILSILSTLISQAQEIETYTVSGNFLNVSFYEFVETVESQTGLHFYYQEELTDSLHLNFGGINIRVKKILDEFLVPLGINYAYKNGNVFLFSANKIAKKLTFIVSSDNSNNPKSDPTIIKTDMEKRYLQGISDVSYDTLEVGNRYKAFANQNASVLGKITDAKTNAPIIGSTLYITEVESGFVSNMDGFFNFKIAPGHYTGIINYINKKEKILKLSIYSDGIFSIELDDKIIPIKELTVIRNRFDRKASMNMGFEHLETDILKKMPVLLGEQDLLKAVQMLPGVLSGGEGSSGFYVRGSNADQNLIYFNKVPIYNTSHLFGFFSSFNSNTVSDLNLYKSNIPAKFGGRLASVLDINAKKGNREHFNLKGGISPITGNVLFEGPIQKNKGSFVLGVRSSYSDYLLSRLEAPSYNKSSANFHDMTFSANYDFGKNNAISIFSYYSSDDFSLADINDYHYNNNGHSLIWKREFSSTLNGELSYVNSRYKYKASNSSIISRAYSQEYQLSHDEIKASINSYKFQNHSIKTGCDAILYQLNRGTIKPHSTQSLIPETPLGREKGIEAAFYISDQIEINTWLNANVGLRYSYFANLGPIIVNNYIPNTQKSPQNIESISQYENNQLSKSYTHPELRLALNAALTNLSSVKLAFNQMTQYIFMMSNTLAISPTDQWKLSDKNLRPQRSNQISLGYYKDFLYPTINTSVEVYGKRIMDIAEYKDGADLIYNPHLEQDVLQGTQDTYGVEFMLEKLKGQLSGWLSYAYSRSLITVQGKEVWDQINNGMQYPSNIDRPHAFNLASTLKLNRRLSLATNVVYTTGRPITLPKSVFYIDNNPYIDYSDRNEYRIPDYFRIDASLNIEGSLKRNKLWHSWWSLGVYNMTGRKNAYSVYFKQQEGQLQAYKLSVIGVPVFTVTWNFKLGNYAND